MKQIKQDILLWEYSIQTRRTAFKQTLINSGDYQYYDAIGGIDTLQQ